MIDSTLEYLYQLHNRGIKLGLDNIKKILNECDNPQFKFRSIHLAGTNGKGSTASIAAKILQTSGYKVGLYTSPHLINFNERNTMKKIIGLMFFLELVRTGLLKLLHVQFSG